MDTELIPDRRKYAQLQDTHTPTTADITDNEVVASFRHEVDGGTLEGRAIATLGYRGMHSFEVSFTDWFVPAAAVKSSSAVKCS